MLKFKVSPAPFWDQEDDKVVVVVLLCLLIVESMSIRLL